jgi:hypothetical protein
VSHIVSSWLLAQRDDRLHVLTHPEWWVPEPMSPRDRIARAIDGRAASVAAGCDRAIRAVGRRNVR